MKHRKDAAYNPEDTAYQKPADLAGAKEKVYALLSIIVSPLDCVMKLSTGIIRLGQSEPKKAVGQSRFLCSANNAIMNMPLASTRVLEYINCIKEFCRAECSCPEISKRRLIKTSRRVTLVLMDSPVRK